MLAYALTFLVLASLVGLLDLGRIADVAWIGLVVFFVLTLVVASARVLDGISQL